MAGLLDSDPDFQTLKSRFNLVEESRQDVLPAIQGAETAVTVANDQLQNNMAVTQGQISAANKQTETALNNIERIETYPDFVSNVIGLFNPDWNKGVQGAKLNQAQHQVNSAASSLKMAEAGRNIAVQEALQRAETIEKFYTFNRQGFLDTQSMINMGFETERNIRQKHLNLVTDTDLETLRIWSEDISKAPKEVQDKPGLIGAELSRKVLSAQQGAINQINLNANSRRRWLNDIGDNAQLEAFLQNPTTLPDYVGQQDVINELARRAKMGLDLDQLQVNLSAKRFDLADKQRNAILDGMNSFELQSVISDIDERGVRETTFRGIPFTRAELNQRLSSAIEEETKTGLALAETAALEAELAGVLTTIEGTSTNIAHLYAPGKENVSYDDLPPHIRTPIQIANRRLNVLSADGRIRSPGGLQVLKDEADKSLEVINKAINDLASQYPKEEQPAVREFANTGSVSQPTVAANYLNSAGDNRSLGVFSSTFNPVFSVFSDKLREIKQAETLDIKTGDSKLTIIESKDPEAVTAVQQAILQSGAKEIAKNVGVQFVLHNAFFDLIKEAPKPGPQERGAENVWQKIYNPLTGRFVPEAYNKDAVGNEHLDLAKLNLVLASETLKLRETGAIPAELTLTDILFSKSIQYSQEYDKTFASDITAASFKTAAYGPTGSPARDVHMAMRIMSESTVKALEMVSAQSTRAGRIASEREKVESGFLGKLGTVFGELD